jgi:chorismate mutase
MSASPTDDPVLHRLREEISATDRAIVDAVNRRLTLVTQVKAYKDARGIDFVDVGRERRMLQELARGNPGPLSAEGLSELFAAVLALTKREVAGGAG